jgi:hypothetical protein
MDPATLISVLALVVSVASFALSLYATFRERAYVKATSTFYPSQQLGDEQPPGPPVLVIRVANHGRRPKKLEYMYIKYANGRTNLVTETLWSSDEHGHYRIGENDVYEHTITPDNDGILHDDDGSRAVDIKFEDTLNHTYSVRRAKKNLTAYLAAAAQFPY